MLPDTVPFVTSVTDPTRWEKASLRGSTTYSTGPKEFLHAQQDGFFSAKAPMVEAPASFNPAIDTDDLETSTMEDEPIPIHEEVLRKLDRLIKAKDSLYPAQTTLVECIVRADPGIESYIMSSLRQEDVPDLCTLSLNVYDWVREIREVISDHELPVSLQDDVTKMLSLSGPACQDEYLFQAEAIFKAARHAYHLITQLLCLADLAEVLRHEINSGQVAESNIPELAWDILEDVGLLMAEES